MHADAKMGLQKIGNLSISEFLSPELPYKINMRLKLGAWGIFWYLV